MNGIDQDSTRFIIKVYQYLGRGEEEGMEGVGMEGVGIEGDVEDDYNTKFLLDDTRKDGT